MLELCSQDNFDEFVVDNAGILDQVSGTVYCKPIQLAYRLQLRVCFMFALPVGFLGKNAETTLQPEGF